jgi:hypothetical protein
MESKLSSDLFLGKMLWNVARNQNVGPDCDETLCRQRHKVSCTWQTKMTGIITPPVTSRKTRILPPSTAELLFLGRKRTLYVAFIARKDADCHFWQSKRQKVCFAVLRAGTIFAAVSTGWRRVIGKDNSILCDCDRTYRHSIFRTSKSEAPRISG